MESLQDYFLIATPKMPDPRFQELVVYICAHSEEEGAMGLVINNPIPDITLADVFKGADIAVPDIPLPHVYMGGPVEMETAFFLYNNDYKTDHFMEINDTVRLSRDPKILDDISIGGGPKQFIFLLGYAGWAPGQLETELSVDGWLTIPADKDVIFNTPDEQKWKKAAELYGIDISIYGDVVGSA